VRDFTRTLSDVRFANCFEGIYPLCVLLPDLHDFAKTTFSYYFEQVESFNCQRFIADRFEVNFEMEGSGSSNGIVPLIRCVLLPNGSENNERREEW